MAVDSYGDRGQPQFSAQGGMDAGADETSLADYSSVVGTRRVGTTAQRLALSGAALFVGLLWGDTTVNEDYRYTSTGWKKVTGLTRADEVSATTSQAGDITITFEPKFTSMCAAIVVMDSNSGAGIGMIPYKEISRSATTAVVRAMSGSSGVPGLSTSLNYIAFGD